MKKLLLIGLRYLHYTLDLVSEIERLGYDVTYHDIQPRTLLHKTARIVWPAYYRKLLDRQHEAILQAEAGNSYDVVLFVQAHQFSRRNIDALKVQQSSAKFVLYNWDAVTTHDYRPNMHVFDDVFTFDPDDAKALGIHYLPLFCCRSFQELDNSHQDNNTVYFVGNIVNIRRYIAVRAFKKYCRCEGITFKHHMVCSPYVFLLLLRDGIIPLDVSFFSIRPRALAGLVGSSSAVFDYANHCQAGYTMRVMENLCAGKKLITNNACIATEPFTTDDRICLFSDLDFSPVKAFLARKVTSPSGPFEEFTIQNFARRLLGAQSPDATKAGVAGELTSEPALGC